MSDHANTTDELDSAEAGLPEAAEPTGVSSVEAYETDDGTVFYDAQNPLAWLKSATALTLEDQA